ncbi:uncharacterized protein BT62DRAFT_983419 [Guyanagaster necrorhizus]|uniref:protein-histidine N-methyltransferase n=1 Tax=Guyanagaster necrorhizus TaxID=856835 RepID=A0A9P7VF74_9AGAR|nr:uncharacterized protein BT62DRAFT_983419 [Guyanagaster necrorhizus MCA 3950]KAG7439467.1 hypothetical protein BT62DRAFT_983419 [Guyanagaster necrorhizus MCA 3950]
MVVFDFDIDDPADDLEISVSDPASQAAVNDTAINQDPFTEVSLQHLVDCLPSLISCSPLSIPLSSGGEVTLARRDLFDARFQLINDEVNDEQKDNSPELGFLNAPSDLVQGVYEGGLKTWECSLDIVDYLHAENPVFEGRRVFEAGCGTAVPSVYILQNLFSGLPHGKETHLHLQDYNAIVFELLTLPNLILAWYMSPASKAYRDAAAHPSPDETPLPPADASIRAEIPITLELKTAFLSSLEAYGIRLRFFSGSWSSFDLHQSGGTYDIVLTSETIYRTDSVGSLIDLLQSVSPTVDSLTSRLSISDGENSSQSYLCLVAAKIFYFGVGGGVTNFVEAVEEKEGRVETVWEQKVGVGRRIMRIQWS